MSSTDSDDDGHPAVVIDNGTGRSRAGYAGDDAPRAYFRTILGRPLDEVGGDFVVGEAAQCRRDVLALKYPIQRRTITDWNSMEKVR